MSITNQSTTTKITKNTTNLCLADNFVSSSLLNILPTNEIKNKIIINKLNNNLYKKRHDHFYVEKFVNIRNRNINNKIFIKKSKEFSFNEIMASEDNNKNNIIFPPLISSSSPHYLISLLLSSLINNINKLFIFSFIFLFISSKILICSTTPINNILQPIILPVGSVFMIEDNLANEISLRQQLPLWMRVDIKNGKKRLFGIPQIKDVGKYKLMFQDGQQSLSIEVSERQPSPCPTGNAPIWLEVLDPREYQRISIEEQLKLAESFLNNFHKSDASFIRRENLRIFPYIYLDHYRTVNEEILSAPVIPNTSLITLILNISCGELSEQASEVISSVADQGLIFRVIEGSLIKPKEEFEQQQKIKTENNIFEEKNKKIEKDQKTSSLSAFSIIGIILFIIFILFIGILIFRWFRTKQQEKRRKQFLDSNKNGTKRPSILNNNNKENNNNTKNNNNICSIISPDASMKTLTTPMLEGNENNEGIKETKN